MARIKRFVDTSPMAGCPLSRSAAVSRSYALELHALAVPTRASGFESIESAVERIVASAPPSSDEQVRRAPRPPWRCQVSTAQASVVGGVHREPCHPACFTQR